MRLRNPTILECYRVCCECQRYLSAVSPLLLFFRRRKKLFLSHFPLYVAIFAGNFFSSHFSIRLSLHFSFAFVQWGDVVRFLTFAVVVSVLVITVVVVVVVIVIFIYIKVKYSLCSCVLLHLVYVLFLMITHAQRDKQKGLVVIATAVNVINALTHRFIYGHEQIFRTHPTVQMFVPGDGLRPRSLACM